MRERAARTTLNHARTGRLFLSPRSRSPDGLRNHALGIREREARACLLILILAFSPLPLVAPDARTCRSAAAPVVALPIAHAPPKRQVRTDGGACLPRATRWLVAPDARAYRNQTLCVFIPVSFLMSPSFLSRSLSFSLLVCKTPPFFRCPTVTRSNRAFSIRYLEHFDAIVTGEKNFAPHSPKRNEHCPFHFPTRVLVRGRIARFREMTVDCRVVGGGDGYTVPMALAGRVTIVSR